LTIVEVDKNYRIVITKEIRKMLSIKPGQKIYLLAAGDKIILMPLPDDIDEELDKLTSNIKWNREVREKLEQYLLSKTLEKDNG